MDREDIIKATRNSLNIYSYGAGVRASQDELRRLQSVETESKERILRLEGALVKEVAINAQLLKQVQSSVDKAVNAMSRRTWVGLTDDEFNELYDSYVPTACYALLIEEVEAKLKEKNT